VNQETWDAACARIAELESLHAADRSYMDAAEKRIAELEAMLQQAVEGWSYWLSKKTSDDPLGHQVWTPEDLMKHLHARAEEAAP
jgi:glutamyl-tRNA reductase